MDKRAWVSEQITGKLQKAGLIMPKNISWCRNCKAYTKFKTRSIVTKKFGIIRVKDCESCKRNRDEIIL